jgi:hypothetical protein
VLGAKMVKPIVLATLISFRERATEIDLDGRITSNPGLFSATDRMDLYPIKGFFTTQQAIQWRLYIISMTKMTQSIL